MESEQFSLCWNNFHNNLSSGFQALFKDEDLVDVTLAAEGRYIKAHKTVLSVCSPYFKELFRVNPCKHPIVILHDVNYSALNNLLQFMYQGEVSVSQEEIPTFMRVAEILKIKGLTDNTNSSINNTVDNTNGLPNNVDSPASSFVGIADRQPIMKRSRPLKKIIKPIQHLKPLELPNCPSPSSQPKSPLPHIVKQPRIEESESKDYIEPLIQPKMEPVDAPDDDEYKEHTFDNDKMDMNAMLDASLGESSEHSMNYSLTKSSDASSPGGLLFLKSRKGHPVLIHNGHMYTLSHKVENRSMWVCVKQRTLNCGGCVTTVNGPMLLSYSGHNHAQLNDVIHRLQASSCSPSPELL